MTNMAIHEQDRQGYKALTAALTNHTAELHQLFYASVAVARSSSDGVLICCVLLVLCTTSCFHTMGPMASHVNFKAARACLLYTSDAADE